jgi:hypothetical protein
MGKKLCVGKLGYGLTNGNSMTKKGRNSAGPVASVSAKEVLAGGPWATPPWTLEERLHRIEAMGLKIEGYIRFMCQVAGLEGASAEAKERAVAAFYDRMVDAERALGHIHEDLRLE